LNTKLASLRTSVEEKDNQLVEILNQFKGKEEETETAQQDAGNCLLQLTNARQETENAQASLQEEIQKVEELKTTEKQLREDKESNRLSFEQLWEQASNCQSEEMALEQKLAKCNAKLEETKSSLEAKDSETQNEPKEPVE